MKKLELSLLVEYEVVTNFFYTSTSFQIYYLKSTGINFVSHSFIRVQLSKGARDHTMMPRNGGRRHAKHTWLCQLMTPAETVIINNWQ